MTGYGCFNFLSEDFFLLFSGEALDVAAVDFDENLLITGFEDTNIGLWSLNDAQRVRNRS